MLGGLFRFGFDQKCPFKPDRTGIVHRHVKKTRHLFLFAPNVCVKQCFVSFAPPPKHIIRASEFIGCGNGMFNLGRGIGEHMRIGVGRRAVGVTRVAEKIGRAPQQSNAGFGLQDGCLLHNLFKVSTGFGKVFAFGGDVPIMEAIEWRSQLSDEFERRIQGMFGLFHGCFAAGPRPEKSRLTKGITTAGLERVPIGNRKTKVLFHGFSGYDLLRIVVLEGQRLLRGLAMIGNSILDLRKIFHSHFSFLPKR